MAKSSLVQWFGRRAAVIAAALCGVALMTVPVLAQFGQRGGGMFDFFGPYSGQPRYYSPSERPQDFSKAPPPRKLDNQPPNTAIVFGDSMADWLAHGLEDALGDTPDIAVVRKNRASAGLIRYDSRNESLDWPQVIRETLAHTKPNFVVMMIGLNDRQQLRDRPIQAGPPTASNPTTAPPLVPQAGAPAPAAPDAQSTDPAQAATSDKPAPGPRTYEFRTDEWAEQYMRRIDATIAALKSAGVPVFWVGLPSIRGQKSTGEMLYLNDMFRGRAEKAGVTYIDVWDGFVDEAGRFSVQGPDFEGQTRRLRVSDGVHFTKAGARKLAHYLEREIRRVMQRGAEPSIAALPAEPQVQIPKGPGAATARPLSGPVVPLTGGAAANQDLLGAAAESATAGGNPRAATRVLIKGEPITPPAGRSDDFRWPRRGVAAFGTDPTVAVTTDPVQAPTPAVAAAPAIATAAAPDAKPENKPATTKKNTSRAQAQAEPRPRRQAPRRERGDDFGGGFGGFGR
ncbi:SGNH/GDSL hydrolase family protein [Rhodoplanes sp. Z2-YC6860]|uniref:SGNH/GDSL hydrolase family protein n=1 Tax=Rhodoplanes sp. Z2-YC6860 TaxID=674703 RepID=UPI00078D21EA|nr:SGNH family hydrolase [Rhodoplanes sp. Z2-YC6860]AMN40163.1 hypothetical protein RHPLAN_17080 [Rhodoplanes sp. Z2-YC6860]